MGKSNEKKLNQNFKIGTVFNKIGGVYKISNPSPQPISIQFPSRLNAMAIDPSLISPNKNGVYTAGEVVFSVGIYKRIHIKSNISGNIEISDRSKRKSLILHAALIMKEALFFTEGLSIDVENENEIKHAGLGSSSGLIASVACAINEFYGALIPPQILLRYLAQNHGEEIENDNEYLCPVQCLGGSAAAGLFKAGMIVLAGESTVIAKSIISEKYKAVIGIPKDYIPLDSKKLLDLEMKNMAKFVNTGKKFGNKIAYNILHTMLPAMVVGDLSAIGSVIYEYRFNMGSIDNCSFAYPKLKKLAKDLAFIKKEDYAPILALSSVGPGFFAITERADECKDIFEKFGLSTTIADIENNGYKLIN